MFQRTTPLPAPAPFSAPDAHDGFNDQSITGDLITDIYHDWAEVRKEEGSMLLRAIDGDSCNLEDKIIC